MLEDVKPLHTPPQLPPEDLPLDKILPDEPLLLMGAGPVPVPSKVAAANSVVINHLGDTMGTIIERVKLMAQYVFQTRSRHVLGVAGPGSAAMEMAISNLVWPGRRVLCVQNGLFSSRFAEMARRVGGETTVLNVPLGQPADPEAVKALLAQERFDVVTLVQGETSCTVWNHALPEICQLAKARGAQTIVDAVCTLSTMPLPMDEWGVDVVVTGGQKGLSSIPGVSLLVFSNEAWESIENRSAPMPHWCLDARLAREFWQNKGYHYTAPVSGILALHEALRLICLETLPARFERHRLCSKALQGAILAMGLTLFVDEPARLNSVVGINVPEGVDANAVLKQMSSRYRVEISGAFGLNLVRIGQMGEQARAHNVLRAVHALGMSMQSAGAKLDVPTGMAELERGLADAT
ncbi:alanine--glyoxylate aminotransferase [Alkalilimnicola ehrlichii]|uniref:Alanine--glyoxylate aminotransferase n=1 Tax=Alkalilimnicola ehrlichii TaxID=351052 RepID=A0A3E0X0K3_9GAMM|nr:alanine--glyoxylate aminotransferase family protein [Alkalilimnicola ehrlichii]RFA30234.1 alanine--glyoxylate aminotransferase [Alkalilimnicola ehrlichii]RFA37816.1 alanine--glyoxylate aminotransferase [Alkalilimnicola ehrlichii]